MAYQETLFELLDSVISEGGSDLHLAEGRRPVMRVSGSLLPLLKREPTNAENMQEALGVLLGEGSRKNFFDTKEADFSYAYKSQARFRGNAYFQQGKIGIALRLIPRSIRTLAELGLPNVLEAFARKPQGFFLVVGPVGQGKTTTLAALIDLINTERAEHIITIEDPVEYLFEEKKSIIDQREVRLDTADFPTALKAMFREDVDVAMIGEMRGAETIATAVTAAETGHLIFSTLHTNNAAQTIDRIIDTFPANQQDQIRVQLAASLSGIFSQRLIQRVSGGLVPAYELLINTPAVGNLIRERRTHELNSVIETGSEYGMVDLNRSLADLVRRGEITQENAYLYSLNPKTLERLL